MIWESPGYLWFLLVIIAFALGSWFYRKRIKILRTKYFSDEVFAKLYSTDIPQVKKARSILLYSGLVLLVIALGGPKIGTEVREVRRQGIDIMVMLDVSKSMYAEDVRPNRLDKAKFELLRLVDRLRGDRVGLITFTGEAVLLSPLTNDYSAFRMFLSIADPESMPSTATDFAAGMRVALEAFDAASEETQEAARVLLILSDGEDHGPDFTPILQQITDRRIFIYTVGIGTIAGGTIPMYDSNTGRLQDYMRDAASQIVTTRLEPNTLRQLANAGRGTYYEITRSSDGMDGFLSQIEELEKREFATQEFADYKNQYQWFAAFGLLFIIISISLPKYREPST
jgi:Ca-activated chloride channel family protein